MIEDSQENSRRMRYFRYAAMSFAALLVLSLGFALIPADPPPPPAPPFTEQARAAALDDALELRAAGLQLAGGTADGGAAAAVDKVVTLLTVQSRALLLPNDATASPTATADNTTPPAAATPPPSAPPAMTVVEFATALAASGSQRLGDAQTADGGMARLLAGAGTAQVLAARELAAAAGAPGAVSAPDTGTVSDPDASAASAPACPFNPADAANTAEPATAAEAAGPGTALAAAAAAEMEAVYGYQAAVPRLPAVAAGQASDFLGRHQALAEDAAAQSRLACGTPLPQAPGYVLEPEFLAAPAAGLARLEAATLPAYGDVVALTDGTTRAWALAALQSAADRTAHWGGDPGPVPGVAMDEARLPPLPG